MKTQAQLKSERGHLLPRQPLARSRTAWVNRPGPLVLQCQPSSLPWPGPGRPLFCNSWAGPAINNAGASEWCSNRRWAILSPSYGPSFRNCAGPQRLSHPDRAQRPFQAIFFLLSIKGQNQSASAGMALGETPFPSDRSRFSTRIRTMETAQAPRSNDSTWKPYRYPSAVVVLAGKGQPSAGHPLRGRRPTNPTDVYPPSQKKKSFASAIPGPRRWPFCGTIALQYHLRRRPGASRAWDEGVPLPGERADEITPRSCRLEPRHPGFAGRPGVEGPSRPGSPALLPRRRSPGANSPPAAGELGSFGRTETTIVAGAVPAWSSLTLQRPRRGGRRRLDEERKAAMVPPPASWCSASEQATHKW